MKHYLIIGASSGIGFELAKRLSHQGHRVTAMSRTAGALTELLNVTYFPLDVTLDEAEMPAIEIPIDGLIYCPGSILLKPFKGLKVEDFLADWKLNVMGAIRVIKQYLPQFADQSSIVFFSTVAVQTGMSFHSSISAAKGAIEGLTRSLAAEFAPRIRVNAIAPSLTQTPLAEKLLNSEAKVQASADRHPLKAIGKPEDMAQAVEFLLQANWVTGQIITVDGGLSSIR
jgi:NAD(P)-dependent dehydrogenase (short-subunit alcohol dehydrogenase family)